MAFCALMQDINIFKVVMKQRGVVVDKDAEQTCKNILKGSCVIIKKQFSPGWCGSED